MALPCIWYRLESWTPTARDPWKVRFARILIEPIGATPLSMLRDATETVLDVLARSKIDGTILLDGAAVAIWIPFDDAPDYVPVRSWLRSIADAAVNASADCFETRHNEPPNRVRLSVRSNAPGLGSALPYTLRGIPGLPVVVPIRRSELGSIQPEDITLEAFPGWFTDAGDVFAAELARIGRQQFASIGFPAAEARGLLGPVVEFVPRAEVIQIAYQILSDGKPRSADEIIDEANARGLWPKEKTRKYLYVMLKMYIEKTLARGRAPLIVQDPDRRFRLNHAPDDNPDPKPPYVWNVPHDLIARVRATATGDDPTAFERAVCDAFEPLGFRTTHVGGNRNPDGYADAILGPLGYRFMIECKTSEGNAAPGYL